MKQKKWILGFGLGAAIAGASLLLATVSPIGLAGAQDESETSREDSFDGEDQTTPGRHDVLGEVLDELVAAGTIERSDADAVEDAMQARLEEIRAHHPGRNGRGHGPGFRRGHGGDELLEALDMTRDELRDALADGRTIEEIAEVEGVDLAEIAAQRLDEAQARLDEAIADGWISDKRAERAQDRIDRARDRIAEGEFVVPGRGPGWGQHGSHGDDGEE